MKTKFLATILFASAVCFGSTVTLTSIGDGLNDGTFYVSPFVIDIDGTAFQAMCYDLADLTGVGTTWQANIINLGAGDVSGTYFADLLKYQEEAWLYQFLLGDRINVQHAAWRIFNPSAPQTYASLAWEQNAALAATSGFPGLDLSTFYLVEEIQDKTVGRQQGFIIQGGIPVHTPEPATLGFIGAGLIGLALIRKRRTA